MMKLERAGRLFLGDLMTIFLDHTLMHYILK